MLAIETVIAATDVGTAELVSTRGTVRSEQCGADRLTGSPWPTVTAFNRLVGLIGPTRIAWSGVLLRSEFWAKPVLIQLHEARAVASGADRFSHLERFL
jgi:hypothetical protein